MWKIEKKKADMFREFCLLNATIIQGEHKVFLWLQTFITKKTTVRGIQTFFFQNVTQEVNFRN